MRVAIQGEPGSNSHVAVQQVFRAEPPPVLVPCMASAAVFERLEDGTAAMAVLPIENSLHGAVFEHFDLLLRHAVRVVGESLVHVRHNLIAAPGTELTDVRRVLSHPVALSQCRAWLRAHPAMEAQPAYDTAGSVKLMMASGCHDAAAIAPELAAELYGARVLQRGLEDHAENYTRFLVLEQGHPAADTAVGYNKASLAFGLQHRPGSLLRALEILYRMELDLTKIESRPVPGKPWEYIFFADVRFASPGNLEQALGQLRTVCTSVRELGRYQAAEPAPTAKG